MADAGSQSQPQREPGSRRSAAGAHRQDAAGATHPSNAWALAGGATSRGRQRDPDSRARMLSPSPHKSNQLLMTRRCVERTSLK